MTSSVKEIFEAGKNMSMGRDKDSVQFMYIPEGFTSKEQHPASQLKLDADWGTSTNLRFLISRMYQGKPLIASAYKRGHKR